MCPGDTRVRRTCTSPPLALKQEPSHLHVYTAPSAASRVCARRHCLYALCRSPTGTPTTPLSSVPLSSGAPSRSVLCRSLCPVRRCPVPGPSESDLWRLVSPHPRPRSESPDLPVPPSQTFSVPSFVPEVRRGLLPIPS